MRLRFWLGFLRWRRWSWLWILRRSFMLRKPGVCGIVMLDTLNTFRLFPKGGLKANARLSGIIHDSIEVVGTKFNNHSWTIWVWGRSGALQYQPKEKSINQPNKRTVWDDSEFLSRGNGYTKKPNLQNVLSSQFGTQGVILDHQSWLLQEDCDEGVIRSDEREN